MRRLKIVLATLVADPGLAAASAMAPITGACR
jgi:hypothetical protein